MKTLFKSICTLILLVTFSGSIHAADYKAKKTLTQTYSTGSNTSLSVDNKYGYIHIQEWDKDQVLIEVTISTKAKSQDEANSLIGTVKVNFSQTGNTVSATTSYDQLRNCNNCSRSVDYQIMVPKGSNYLLKNKYGDISLNNTHGSLDIDLAYGDLSGNNLKGEKNSISVQYGDITINELVGKTNQIKARYADKIRINTSNNMEMQADYSDLTLGTVNTLNIQSSYTDVNIQQVKELTFRSRYEDYKIGTADKIKGEGNYTDMKISRLNRSLDLSKLGYGDLSINLVDPGFESITATVYYSDSKIQLDPNASCQVDLSGRYADFSLKSTKKNITTKSDNLLKGSIGSASSNSLIRISSQYGDVEIKQ